MTAALLLLASIALIVLKAAGILSISWLIALLPAIILLGLSALGALVFLVLAMIGKEHLVSRDL